MSFIKHEVKIDLSKHIILMNDGKAIPWLQGHGRGEQVAKKAIIEHGLCDVQLWTFTQIIVPINIGVGQSFFQSFLGPYARMHYTHLPTHDFGELLQLVEGDLFPQADPDRDYREITKRNYNQAIKSFFYHFTDKLRYEQKLRLEKQQTKAS